MNSLERGPTQKLTPLSVSLDAPSRPRRCGFCCSGHASSPDDSSGPFASGLRHSHPHAPHNPHPAHQRGAHAALCSPHHEPPPAAHDCPHRSVTSPRRLLIPVSPRLGLGFFVPSVPLLGVQTPCPTIQWFGVFNRGLGAQESSCSVKRGESRPCRVKSVSPAAGGETTGDQSEEELPAPQRELQLLAAAGGKAAAWPLSPWQPRRCFSVEKQYETNSAFFVVPLFGFLGSPFFEVLSPLSLSPSPEVLVAPLPSCEQHWLLCPLCRKPSGHPCPFLPCFPIQELSSD